MTTRQVTIGIVCGSLAGALLWDAYAAANEKDDDTISEFLEGVGCKYPVVPMLIGLVCGHLFWPMIERKEKVQQ